MYLAALLADFQINGGVNQILIHGGAFSSSEVLGKNTSIQSKLLTRNKLAGVEKREEGVKQTSFAPQATSVPRAN